MWKLNCSFFLHTIFCLKISLDFLLIFPYFPVTISFDFFSRSFRFLLQIFEVFPNFISPIIIFLIFYILSSQVSSIFYTIFFSSKVSSIFSHISLIFPYFLKFSKKIPLLSLSNFLFNPTAKFPVPKKFYLIIFNIYFYIIF